MIDCYPPDPPDEFEPKRPCTDAARHLGQMINYGFCFGCGLGIPWAEWMRFLAYKPPQIWGK